MSFLAELLAKLAVLLLRELLHRRSLRDQVLYDISRQMLELAARAEDWRRDAAARGVGSDLRVRRGAPTLELPRQDPGAESRADRS